MQGIPNNNPPIRRQDAVVEVAAGADPAWLGPLLLVQERRMDPTYICHRRMFTTSCVIGLSAIFIHTWQDYFQGVYPLGKLALLGTSGLFGVLGGIAGYILFTRYISLYLDAPRPQTETIGSGNSSC